MIRHIPRKRFGQHFLTDENVIANIIAGIGPRSDDRIVEIGPGRGALTRPLLRVLAHLDVVEIDRDLVAELRREMPSDRITIHEADALRFDFSSLGDALRVIGNLPYNISTPLLFHLTAHSRHIHDIHVMLQKEVVERMTAAPGGADYGRLSVMLQFRFDMEWLFSVPPSAFQPPPEVESAVVRMVPRPAAAGRCDEVLLAELVKSAFMHRRKTLRNAWRTRFGERDFSAIGIDPDARAQELTVEDFVKATHYTAERSQRG